MIPILQSGELESSSQSDLFQLQILSDLHLEGTQFASYYSTFSFPASAPALALVGDIGKANDPELLQFLTWQCYRYRYVFYVLGNHEAYDSSYSAAADKIRSFGNEIAHRRLAVRASDKSPADDVQNEQVQVPGEFIFLNRGRFDVPDSNLTILGCTLFSHIRAEQREDVAMYCNDFVGPFGDKGIPGWTTDMHNAAHGRDLAWLNRVVQEVQAENANRQIVILSHHSPSVQSIANDPAHVADERGVQSAFTTDLSAEPCWTSKAVCVWVFGHTHFNCDFTEDINGRALRLVANQKGYSRNENVDFDEAKVIDISLTRSLGPEPRQTRRFRGNSHHKCIVQ